MSIPSPSVAIVDDDSDFVTALRRLLKSAGFLVHAFDSGKEFLDSASGAELDCVLLDVHMPEISGFAVAQRLAARSSTVPLIFMTANDNESNRCLATEHGAAGYLRKPAGENEILSAIRKAIIESEESGRDPG